MNAVANKQKSTWSRCGCATHLLEYNAIQPWLAILRVWRHCGLCCKCAVSL